MTSRTVMQPSRQSFTDALCTEVDPDIFFPDPSDLGGIFEAKSICSECPLTRQCLQYAIDNSLKDGIFGGMTPKERERHRVLRWKADYRQRQRQRALGRSV